jgi:hypothetical protein
LKGVVVVVVALWISLLLLCCIRAMMVPFLLQNIHIELLCCMNYKKRLNGRLCICSEKTYKKNVQHKFCGNSTYVHTNITDFFIYSNKLRVNRHEHLKQICKQKQRTWEDWLRFTAQLDDFKCGLKKKYALNMQSLLVKTIPKVRDVSNVTKIIFKPNFFLTLEEPNINKIVELQFAWRANNYW